MNGGSPSVTVAAARDDPTLVVVEGFHALKHALRVGAELVFVVVETGTDLTTLAPGGHALPSLPVTPVTLAHDQFADLARPRPSVPVVAVARRPTPSDVGALRRDRPLVVLERPNHPGNLGAVVRVAAAADAAGVVCFGGVDPWGAAAVRGAAGLTFALPVIRTDAWPDTDRPVLAFDPSGRDLNGVVVQPGSMMVFGTERDGLSPAVRDRADEVVRIPMAPPVSSLNLATAVAIALYAQPAAPEQPVR